MLGDDCSSLQLVLRISQLVRGHHQIAYDVALLGQLASANGEYSW